MRSVRRWISGGDGYGGEEYRASHFGFPFALPLSRPSTAFWRAIDMMISIGRGSNEISDELPFETSMLIDGIIKLRRTAV